MTDAFATVEEEIGRLEHELVRKYTLTKFFLLYLLGEALRTDDVGKSLMTNPSELLGDPIVEEIRQRFAKAIRTIIRELVIDLNYEIQDRSDKEYFDHKRVLKSPSEVRELRRGALSSYEKLVQRGRIPSFSENWDQLTDELKG